MTSQDPRTVWSQTTGHILLHPQDMLGSGGEGSVYRLQNHPKWVAKIYHRNKFTNDTINKLEVMIDYPPRTEDEQTGHLFVSWPKDTVHDTDQGAVIGFLMPMVDKTNDLYECYNPSSRRRNAPHVNYANLCSVAKSLAAALDRLHGITYAYIIGDINESNAYITEGEHVTLIDADSFQVTDRRTTPPTIYRCIVGKPEYTPPELQGLSFAQIDRNIHHDNFALAVVIYQLLMEGTHPFRGIYTDPGEKPQVEACMSRGYFLHGARVGRQIPLTPPPTTLPWESLPANLRGLFRRCFDDGHAYPDRRPAPREWEDALDEAIQDLRQCAQNPSHWYFGGQSASGSPACTWCERKASLGIESFPHHPGSRISIPANPKTPQQPAQPPSPPPPSPPANGRPPDPTSRPSGRRWILRLALAAMVFLFAVLIIDELSSAISDLGSLIIRDLAGPPSAPIVAIAPANTPTVAITYMSVPTNTPTGVVAIYTPVPPNTPIAAAVVPTNTPIPTNTPTHTSTPTNIPTPRATFTPSPTSTSRPTSSPTATHTPVPTSTPTSLPTLTPTPPPTATATAMPTPTPSAPDAERCKKLQPGADLSECNFRRKDMKKIELTGAKLINVNLNGANLEGAELDYADLTGATLIKANLNAANLKNATLANANMTGASVKGATFDNAVGFNSANISGIESFNDVKIKRVTFHESVDLSNISFERADLSHSVLIKANLQGANLTNALLNHANFSDAVLSGATLKKAKVKGINLDGAKLDKADLTAVSFEDFSFNRPPIFVGAILQNASFSKTDLRGLDFSGADMKNADFEDADLCGLDFSGADMKKADFEYAEMKGTIFDNADLNEAVMIDANIQRARFNGADLSGVNFSKSDLSNASFQGADIEEVKFFEANLTNANFSGATNADKAFFDDTICSDGSTSSSCYSDGKLHGARP